MSAVNIKKILVFLWIIILTGCASKIPAPVENQSYEYKKSSEEKKKETITTTAWYTLQVPVSNGPDNFQGLPGLILEINDGERLIVCTEIILNPSEKIEVKAPEKGEIVSQAAYNKIQKEKSKELMDRFKGRNGVNMGGGINIKIGG